MKFWLLFFVCTLAVAESDWPYRAPAAVAPPAAGHPIDAFIDAKLAGKGIAIAPKAGPHTLIRRLALDLTGLPPALEDFKLSYERAIDKYLASPQYGERWGRHWLDLARYADSNGYEHDFNRPNAWRYRDYVIRAFNEDKPYDQFLREQIAGDELDHVTFDSLIATGFLRNYAKVGYREKDNPEFRLEYIDDMIATVGRGLIGLTVQCARCHNHKFDKITQGDYQRMKAALWGYVEVDHPLVDHDRADQWRTINAEIDGKLKVIKLELAEFEKPYKDKLLPAKLAKFPANVKEAIATPEDRRTPGQVLLANQVLRTTGVSSKEVATILSPDDKNHQQKLLADIAALEAQRPVIPVAMGITDGDFRFTPDGPGDEPAPGKGVKQEVTGGSFLCAPGTPYRMPPGAVSKLGFPASLTTGEPPVALPPHDGCTSGRRRALVEWLVSKNHPLTARVFVNRVWHHHFGRGIVASIDNFGKTGDPPTHPELLDWLALRFIEDGWSLKKLHRLILTSAVYQRSSNFDTAENQIKDPDDTLLWRFRAHRLEAEAVRDLMLAAGGNLNLKMEGPPVFPPLPAEIRAQMLHGIWEKQEDGPQTWRRSVYVYRKRGLPFPLFEVFDLPDQNVSCGRRNTTTVPTQALTLLNNQFVLDQSKRLAARVKEATIDRAKQVEMIYEITLTRKPEPREQALAMDYLKTGTLDGLAHVILNTSEFLYLR